MDLDLVLSWAIVGVLFVALLYALMLYANERDEETGSRSLTLSDSGRFRSLLLVEKVFAVVVMGLVVGIASAVAVTVAVMAR